MTHPSFRMDCQMYRNSHSRILDSSKKILLETNGG